MNLLHADSPTLPLDRSQHEILVVDDEPASRYATARLLRSVGFRTREAGTGAEALQQADESISAVVLDVHLPDIDGMEVCRRLRERHSLAHLPVLHLSAAYITDEDKVRGLDAGADAYLTHPVEPAVIVAAVQALVRARAAETAMRASELKFRAIYEDAPSGICLIDQTGRLVEMNPAMAALVRRPQAEVLGRLVSELAPEEHAGRVHEHFTVSDEAWQGEFPLQDAQGQPVDIEWRLSARTASGLRMAVATDISQRRELERARQDVIEREQAARTEAERIARMKDELVAVLSHELRTPLTAIMAWADILQRRPTTENLERGLDVIKRNCRMQARLLSDILDASRMNAGKLQLQLSRVDPQSLLIETLDTLRPSVEAAARTLEERFQGPFRPVAADAARFQQIVANLLSNAVKFSPPESAIVVSMSQSDEGLRLSVADQGRGIEPEFLPHLFERFSQEDARANRQHGGLGLGLSIAQQLAQLHGGSLSAHSEGLGKGAVFHLDLPNDGDAASAAGTPSEAASDGPAAQPRSMDNDLHGIRVMLVDDDIDAALALQMMLHDRGAQVSIAHSHDAALELLRQGPAPTILVSDLGMPGKTGFDLIRTLRLDEAQRGSHLPAIALSAFTREADVEAARAAGFDAHCAKPLWLPDLVQLIQQFAPDPRAS